jgi:hypothetical protein
VFWRRSKKEKPSKIEIPSLEDLEQWVSTLIRSLELKEGSFTILPAFGGILLFIMNEGITWIPYKEIREALGKVNKMELADSTTTLGVAAAVVATGGSILPVILVRGILKGSYRSLVNPPPVVSRTFLNSMIKEVLIEEHKLSAKLLKTFEEDPYKNDVKDVVDMPTYRIYITRKFLDYPEKKTKAIKAVYGLKSFFFRSMEPEFSVPQQSDTKKFAEILESNNVPVRWKVKEKEMLPESADIMEED